MSINFNLTKENKKYLKGKECICSFSAWYIFFNIFVIAVGVLLTLKYLM